MRIILGIGNPGRKYVDTKHNIGFIILDKFAQKYGLKFKPSKFGYIETGSSLDSSRFALIKPTTYVNNSGLAALDVLDYYNLPPEDLLVISDDVNLELGKIRIRKSGGDGGHNGLKSIIYHLNSDQFARLRFGIGDGFDEGEMADYVLSKFSKKNFDYLEQKIVFSVKLIEHFILGGSKEMLDFFSKNSSILNKIEREG